MVFLRDLQQQWPWNPANQNLADKEIYTHHIDEEDASKTWRVPVLDPMNGFAYTGMRVVIYGKEAPHTVVPKLVLGYTNTSMFGLPWDHTICTVGVWAPLGFPITNKITAVTEDHPEYIFEHSEPCWGKVEFVAQRFEDLMEDEKEISYVFLNHRTDKVEWILNAENFMYKPRPYDGPVYKQKSKLMPSVWRLLDKDRNPWDDTALWWNQVNIPVPLLQ